jgi:starch synthase
MCWIVDPVGCIRSSLSSPLDMERTPRHRKTLHLVLMPSHIRDSGAATAGVAFARAAAELGRGEHVLAIPPQYAEWAPDAHIWQRSRPMETLFRMLPESAEFVFSGRRMLKEFARTRPTHVHLHHLIPSLDFLRACLYARIFGARLVWSTHGLVEVVTPRQTYGLGIIPASLWHLLVRFPIAIGAQLCDLVIIGAERDSRWLKKIGISRKPTLVVPNGSKFDLTELPPVRPPSDPPVLLFVGAHVRSKGLEVLFEALDAVDCAFEMRIVGKQREHIDYSVAEKINSANNDVRRVKFCGRVTDDELLDHYLEADLFVLPSLSDTQPLVMIDALATGTPVLATDVGSVSDILNERTGRTVEPGSVRALRNSLNTLLGDATLLASMRVAARESADQYQWATAASNIQNRLNDIESVRPDARQGAV